MSQLSHLIEQARKTRRVNEIFNIEPAAVAPQDDALPPDILLVRLAELESILFDNPSLSALPVEDILIELEAIASEV